MIPWFKDYRDSPPQSAIDLLSPFFGQKDILTACKMVGMEQVTLSFQKGSPEDYLIVSGIVRESKTYETRLTYKGGAIKSSSCNCALWKERSGSEGGGIEKAHCPHVAALFLAYHQQSLSYHLQSKNLAPAQTLASVPRSGESNESSAPLFHEGQNVLVPPREFGGVLEDPQKINPSLPHLDFTHCKYLLTGQRLVPFPTAQAFSGQLIIDLRPEDGREGGGDSRPNQPPRAFPVVNYRARFFHQREDGQEQIKTSLLNVLYLFDWEEGEALELPSLLKDVIIKLRNKGSRLPLQDYLKLTEEVRKRKMAVLRYGQHSIDELPHVQTHFKVFISPDKKGNFLHFSFGVFDDKDNQQQLPQTLSLLCFQNGPLSSFRKKGDAFEFLKGLHESIGENLPRIQPYLRFCTERIKVIELVSTLLSSEHEYGINLTNDTVYLLETHLTKALFSALIESFGPSFFRFSSFNEEKRMLQFQTPTAVILQNIALFHSKVALYGIPIYYNNTQILTWKSNHIRLERRSTRMDWFDLQVEIGMDDLEFLRNLDPSENFALTSKGLMLLSPAERDLVRFLKKYSRFDKIGQKGGEEEVTIVEEPGTDGGPGKATFNIPFFRARIFELFELHKRGITGALTEEEISLCQRLLTLNKIPEYDVPSIGEGQPRSYQLVGYHWLRFLHENRLGACLADDMGLGKTLQTIMFIKSVISQVERVLIVCPVSIIINWLNEFNKFSDLKVHLYYGGNRSKFQDERIIITSYGVMKKEALTTFKDMAFDILILDEIQHLKNIKSLGATAARKIKAKFRISLTGTPVENSLTEFYNILDLSMPGLWGHIHLFKSEVQKDEIQWAKKMARPFILRRTKAQVLTDLPEKIDNYVFLNFSDEEQTIYKNSLLSIRHRIQTVTQQKRYGEVLKGLLELRQLCLWQKGDAIGDGDGAGNKESTPHVLSTKMDFLEENLEQILEEGHQAIVFSQFTSYLDLIEKRIKAKNWKFSRIDGGQSIQQRQKQVDLFQSGENTLFLISLKAGGVGLNLTAASFVFLMDPWWNPAVESQAIDRAHRIGQKNKLTVYRPIMKDSVEEKVLKLQRIKKELFEDLLNEGDEQFFSGKLTMEDFEALFY